MITSSFTTLFRGLAIASGATALRNKPPIPALRRSRDREAHQLEHPFLRAFALILTLTASIGGLWGDADAAGRPATVLLAQAAPVAPAPGSAGASPEALRGGPMADVEARISELHKQLQITPAEEPLFKAYAEVMRKNAQAMHALFSQRAQNSDRSAIGQLRWYAKLTAAHAEAVGKLIGPFEALYQSMPDHQKKIADSVFAQLRQRAAPHRAR